MKHPLFVVAFMLWLQLGFTQNDTGKIYNAKTLKKGFYKSYEEFINNSPSIVTEIYVAPLVKSKTDTTVIGGDYLIEDTVKKPSHVWGFCDGANVYVTTINSIYIKKKFWKLHYIGAYPFFTIAHKDIYLIGGPPLIQLATAATSALMPVQYDLVVIDEKGRFKEPTARLMKKWMKDQPILLNAFKEEMARYEIYDDPTAFRPEESIIAEEKTKKDYLIKLNEALKSK